MDRRTVTALLLVALVLLLTPRLFPGKPRVGTLRDKTADTSRTAQPNSGSQPTAVPSIPQASPSPVAGDNPRDVPLIITGKNTEFHFSTSTAALTAVRLNAFKNLTAKDGTPAQLMTPGGALLVPRVVSGGDTISLSGSGLSATVDSVTAGAHRIMFAGSVRGSPLQLTYTVVPDSFLVRVSGSVMHSGSAPEIQYLLLDLPATLRSYEADTVDDQRHLAYAYRKVGENSKSISFGSLDPGEHSLASGPFTWVVAKNKYFLLGVLAPDGDSLLTELSAVGGPRSSKIATIARGNVVISLKNQAFSYEIYAGPQQWRRLHALGREFETANPYGGFLQGFVQPFATIVMKILLWMRENLKFSYGWVLVIFGITVRVALWPLNQKGMRASMKMQRIQPELNEIQKRYKGDPEKLQSEMMRVYKEHNMSPFSTFTGCLPLFLPLPILFALFFVFQNTIEFRGVPFLWFPDISQKDPFYIVPLTMGVSMFGLSWIGMRNTPPNPQTKMMGYVLPVMMTFLFANFPSGLNLYYTIQNLAALPQQWLIANERAKSGVASKR